MKFFHLSDLHIGFKLYNRDLYEDQLYIFEQIIKAAGEEQPDAVVIAGDIYDRAIPASEAVEVFDQFISRLTQAVPNAEIMMISGNHDSAPRVNVFRSVLQRQRIHMIGMPPQLPGEYIEKVTRQDAYGDVNFYLLPFVKPSMVKSIVGCEKDGSGLSYSQNLTIIKNGKQLLKVQKRLQRLSSVHSRNRRSKNWKPRKTSRSSNFKFNNSCWSRSRKTTRQTKRFWRCLRPRCANDARKQRHSLKSTASTIVWLAR